MESNVGRSTHASSYKVYQMQVDLKIKIALPEWLNQQSKYREIKWKSNKTLPDGKI